jgi:hypothetical protein
MGIEKTFKETQAKESTQCRPDLDALMKEAQKDEMIVSIENIIVCE